MMKKSTARQDPRKRPDGEAKEVKHLRNVDDRTVSRHARRACQCHHVVAGNGRGIGGGNENNHSHQPYAEADKRVRSEARQIQATRSESRRIRPVGRQPCRILSTDRMYKQERKTLE